MDRKPTHKRRTQAERSDASEQSLLTAAATVMEAEGFAAATFERIGEVAGYSRGLASQKFGSKDGVVRAVIEFVAARVQDELDASIRSTPNPLEGILRYMEIWLSGVETDPLLRSYFVMLSAAVANRMPIQTAFQGRHDDVKNDLAGLVRRGQARGLIDPTIDPEITALSIGCFQIGTAVQLLLDPKFDIAAVRESVLPLLRYALQSPHADAQLAATGPAQQPAHRPQASGKAKPRATSRKPRS
ncbi:MAG: TetR/AcrR family transcriptional regulator [Rhizomicrobium sp.]